MRVLIVDDEAPARAKLRRLLSAEPDVEIAGEASNGRDAISALGRLDPDVVFLDVQMPIVNGFGVIEAVGIHAMPYVVFVTAYDEHALQAFEVQALDYLLKPFAPERLQAVVSRLRKLLERNASNSGLSDRLARLLETVGPTASLQRLLVERDGRAVLLPVEQIDWIEAERNDARLHTRSGTHTLRSTLTELASRLDASKFLRINRSTIVRLDAIRELQPWFHGDYRVVMQDGTELMWSRRFRARDRAAFEVGRAKRRG